MPGEGTSGMVGYIDDAENRAVVCGGRGQYGSGTDRCYEYSIGNDRWNEASFRMKEERRDLAAVLLANGSFMVTGGSRFQVHTS